MTVSYLASLQTTRMNNVLAAIDKQRGARNP